MNSRFYVRLHQSTRIVLAFYYSKCVNYNLEHLLEKSKGRSLESLREFFELDPIIYKRYRLREVRYYFITFFYV